jgi:putative ABC transport system permease protein
VRQAFYEITEGLRIAGRAIWVNKMRSVLTTLGIIIGIASVTGMATVINGIDRQFEEALSEFGTDVLYVRRWPLAGGPGTKWWEYINRPRIEPDLAEVIAQRSRYAVAAIPTTSTSRAVGYRSTTLTGVSINGVGAEYPRVRDPNIEEGRFFSPLEARSADNVVVLGATVTDELFPIEQPLGKTITIDGRRFRVIGTQVRQGSDAEGGSSADNQVKIPFATFGKLFGTRQRSIDIEVKVASVDAMDRAADEITGIVRVARKLDAMEENNFEIASQEDVRRQFAPVKFAIYGIGLFLTALALLVGGIGVMNIMFVSVKERTKEIGIRKAVGAKRSTILTQFLIESIIICLLGGALGIGISAGLTTVLTNLIGIQAALPFETVMLAFGICTGVGVAFGLAPAWQAAQAEPIAALRYE